MWVKRIALYTSEFILISDTYVYRSRIINKHEWACSTGSYMCTCHNAASNTYDTWGGTFWSYAMFLGCFSNLIMASLSYIDMSLDFILIAAVKQLANASSEPDIISRLFIWFICLGSHKGTDHIMSGNYLTVTCLNNSDPLKMEVFFMTWLQFPGH